ncbi:hypothetical protein Zmor_021713 [Zophobas morio]|uniref:Uncharacterized protein n=1 Tax=Zophobas morio TaxID=2755281 RepID=A0AA38MAQ7_9CUCU|nr:hypothetical protein Zmor_021713 [Zophobas morio]
MARPTVIGSPAAATPDAVFTTGVSPYQLIDIRNTLDVLDGGLGLPSEILKPSSKAKGGIMASGFYGTTKNRTVLLAIYCLVALSLLVLCLIAL